MDDWSAILKDISDNLERAETSIATHLQAIEACEERLASIADEDLRGLCRGFIALGLAIGEVEKFVSSAPQAIELMMTGLNSVDAQVARGELPSTAHSWRFSLTNRVSAAERDVGRLRQRIENFRANLTQA